MTNFWRQYRAWLSLLVALLIVTNILLLLDEGLASVSIIYLNSIYIVVTALFIVWRMRADTQLMKNLEEADLTPLQQAVAHHYEEELQKLRLDVTTYKMHVAEQSDEQLAWIHEMKAPLTAQQLMMEQMPAGDTKYKLEQEWLRIYSLLDQQLYSARLYTMEQDLCYEKVQLYELVALEVKSFKSWCIEKGIGFELEDLAYTVVSDAKWLAYIVRQLLSNAIKYSAPNSEISIFTSVDEEGHLVLHVRDAGKGIAAHDLPRVFQKSYTGSTGRESSAASGMGLYLAKQAAEKMGHKIMLDSAVGLGTTAKIQFPLENEYTKQFGM